MVNVKEEGMCFNKHITCAARVQGSVYSLDDLRWPCYVVQHWCLQTVNQHVEEFKRQLADCVTKYEVAKQKALQVGHCSLCDSQL